MAHGNCSQPAKKRAPMIRYRSQKQLSLAEFDWPFQVALDENNRWVKLSQCIPWDELAEGYYQSLSEREGRPAKDARLVIGAVIIKHKLCLSIEETVEQIRETPYQHYFVGLPGYQMEAPFAPSLFVEIRKRMGQSVFDVFQGAIIDAVESAKPKQKAKRTSDDEDDEPVHADRDRREVHDRQPDHDDVGEDGHRAVARQEDEHEVVADDSGPVEVPSDGGHHPGNRPRTGSLQAGGGGGDARCAAAQAQRVQDPAVPGSDRGGAEHHPGLIPGPGGPD